MITSQQKAAKVSWVLLRNLFIFYRRKHNTKKTQRILWLVPTAKAWARVKSPELSMGPDSSSSINLSYLKLSRWRTRCRFQTFVLLLLFKGGFVDEKSSTEDWISSNIAFVRIGKWSKEKRWQMNRTAKGSRWTASATNTRVNLNRKTNLIR